MKQFLKSIILTTFLTKCFPTALKFCIHIYGHTYKHRYMLTKPWIWWFWRGIFHYFCVWCLCCCLLFCPLSIVLNLPADPASFASWPCSKGQSCSLHSYSNNSKTAECKQKRDFNQQLQIHLLSFGLFLFQGWTWAGTSLPQGKWALVALLCMQIKSNNGGIVSFLLSTLFK